MKKLFLVTRRDLLPGDQAVQSAHALTEFVMTHPEIARDWHRESNTLIMKAVRDEEELHELVLKAQARGIRFAVFREPDRANELTAIAIEPNGKKLVQGMPLALAPKSAQEAA